MIVGVPPGLRTELDGIFLISLDEQGRYQIASGAVAQTARLTARPQRLPYPRD
jgi:hypothetical protein